MADATTAEFHEFVLEVEEPAGSGTFVKLCGITDFTYSHSTNVDTTEIPDCDDESLPLSVKRSIRSVEYNVSADGVWSQESHQLAKDWVKLTQKRVARIGYLKAAVGDTEYETGPAIMTNLEHRRTKGQVVSASFELMFDGTPAATAKAA